MGQPAAKDGDRIVAVDVHLIQPPPVPPPPPILVPHPFSGAIGGGLSDSVFIEGKAAATVGSTATVSHTPIGGLFVNPPQNRGEIVTGSLSVSINGKRAARAGDTATTCNDPVPLPTGSVVATSTVLIGG